MSEFERKQRTALDPSAGHGELAPNEVESPSERGPQLKFVKTGNVFGKYEESVDPTGADSISNILGATVARRNEWFVGQLKTKKLSLLSELSQIGFLIDFISCLTPTSAEALLSTLDRESRTKTNPNHFAALEQIRDSNFHSSVPDFRRKLLNMALRLRFGFSISWPLDESDVLAFWTSFEALPPVHVEMVSVVGRTMASIFDPKGQASTQVRVSGTRSPISIGADISGAMFDRHCRHEVGHAYDSAQNYQCVDRMRAEGIGANWEIYKSLDELIAHLLQGKTLPQDAIEALKKDSSRFGMYQEQRNGARTYDSEYDQRKNSLFSTSQLSWEKGLSPIEVKTINELADVIHAIHAPIAQRRHVWTEDDGGGVIRNGRIYAATLYSEKNPFGAYVSYDKSAKTQRQLTPQQFRASAEWFAECYQCYFNPDRSAGREFMKQRDPAAHQWFVRNVDPTHGVDPA